MADKISNKEFEESLLAGSQPTGASSGSKKVLLDLLHERFGADDLVKIKNFTGTKTGWVYSDKKGVKIEQPNEFTRRVWQGAQKARVLEAGKTVIVPGWEAYIALVRFYKQWVQESGDTPMMSSPTKQAEFVEKACLGVIDPNDLGVEAPVAEATKDEIKAEVDKDLGLAKGDEKKKA